jgi:hypothetical protein
MKKTLIYIFECVTMLLVVLGGLYLYNTVDFTKSIGSAYLIGETNLIGSNDDLKALPFKYNFADSTTTEAYVDGGAINQLVATDGIDKVRLYVKGIAVTATGTIDIYPMMSLDGSNYFNVMYNTSTTQMLFGNGTTTPSVAGFAVRFTPGVATSSWTYDLNVSGARYMRFILKTEDVDGDRFEKTQAFINVAAIDSFH